ATRLVSRPEASRTRLSVITKRSTHQSPHTQPNQSNDPRTTSTPRTLNSCTSPMNARMNQPSSWHPRNMLPGRTRLAQCLRTITTAFSVASRYRSRSLTSPPSCESPRSEVLDELRDAVETVSDDVLR